MSTSTPMSATAPPVLSLNAVSKDFHARGYGRHGGDVLRAIDGVSLELRDSQTLGVVGESGSGKSTLAKLLVRLERPTSGEVSFMKNSIASFDAPGLKMFRRHVQMVFQDPYSSLPSRMSIRQILTEPLIIHQIGDQASRLERVRELVDQVGLRSSDLKRYPHEFSGGQRQRIAIARALMIDPRVVICDEPVSALDVSIRAQILKLLHDLQADRALGYLVISHDLRVVRYLCEDVAVMYLGRIVEQGRTAGVLERPAHPYTRALVGSVLDPEMATVAKTRRLSVLSGQIPSPLDRPQGCHFHPRCPLRSKLAEADQARCVTERPGLRALPDGRHAACHYAEKVLEHDRPHAPTDVVAGAG